MVAKPLCPLYKNIIKHLDRARYPELRSSNYPQMANLDQFQNTLLVPFIKSYTYDNALLMSSLKYNWYNYNGDLILIIDINYHGDPIICKGGRLPYRCDSAKMIAEGVDLVNMVKKLTKNAA